MAAYTLAQLISVFATASGGLAPTGAYPIILQTLATHRTTPKAAFADAHGSLPLAEATPKAYDVIVGGSSAAAAGIDVAAAVGFLSGAASIDYFTQFITANTALASAADIQLVVKAAIVGEIFFAASSANDGAGVGVYAAATNQMLLDLAQRGALAADNPLGIDLLGAYPTLAGLAGHSASATAADGL